MTVSGEAVRGENARRPVSVVCELQLADSLAACVLQLQMMADSSAPSGDVIGDSGIFIGECRAIGGNDQISSWTEGGIRRKCERNAFCEPPARDVGCDCVGIAKLDIAFEEILRGWMIH